MSGKLPGWLVMAQHLRSHHEAVEIMLRAEAGSGATGQVAWYVIYLDGKEADRVKAKWEVRGGIGSPAHAAYDRMDEIAGYPLADDRGFGIEASMGR